MRVATVLVFVALFLAGGLLLWTRVAHDGADVAASFDAVSSGAEVVTEEPVNERRDPGPGPVEPAKPTRHESNDEAWVTACGRIVGERRVPVAGVDVAVSLFERAPAAGGQ